jgi:hypothetical protein
LVSIFLLLLLGGASDWGMEAKDGHVLTHASGDFFATIAGFMNNIPVVGPYIASALEKISGGRRNAELPV